MFVDEAKIFVKGGDGGNGAVAFHREKYVAAGGPDGGDGGCGGSVVLTVDTNMSTLMDFRYKKKYVAGNGMDGTGGRMKGKDGVDLIINVPDGTVVKDAESGRVICDLSGDTSSFTIARGGKGGWGNARFATATRQTPNFAKAGRKGQIREIILELKLIADVGLVGFPNVGKSTLLSVVSDAKPKIGNYHFTTLNPNLGVVNVFDGQMVMADIPGIIEGANEGVGLGHDFLRHIERTRLLMHIVDISGCEGRNPIDDFNLINNELKKYSEKLSDKLQIVVANKIDVTDMYLEEFKKYIESLGLELFVISAYAKKGTDELVKRAYTLLQDIPVPVFEAEAAPEPEQVTIDTSFEIEVDDDVYIVTGESIELLVNSTNFEDTESVSYFQRMLRKSGIIARLEEMGINDGDTVRINDLEFDYYR